MKDSNTKDKPSFFSKLIGGLFNLLRFLYITATIIVILAVLILPFEKAEHDNRIVLLNPITLKYVALTVSSENGQYERQSLSRGVATVYHNEQDSYFVFGNGLATYRMDASEFTIDNNSGKFDYLSIIRLIFIGGT